MNGAHRNHARDQMTAENMRIFFFSDDTKSAVQAISRHRPVEVATLIAIDGIISNATTCDSCTVYGKFDKKNIEQQLRRKIEIFIKNNVRVSGINQVK